MRGRFTREHISVLHNRAAHVTEPTVVRQIAWKPQPPIELLTPIGDDDAPGDRPACEGSPHIVHGRQKHLVSVVIIDCQRLTRRRGKTVALAAEDGEAAVARHASAAAETWNTHPG
jgi:hypothetical protein